MENSVAQSPDLSEALSRLGDVYSGLARAQRRLRGRDAMRPGQLTVPQVSLLRPLAEKGPMSSGQLAEAAGLTPATTTHMLDQLAVAGVVERERQVDDRRVVISRLTDQGVAMLTERLDSMAIAWNNELSVFDREQLEIASEVLEAICRFADDL